MSKTGPTPTLRKLDRRLTTVEQILPALATREDLRRAIEPLATREELRAEGERTRRHFDIVAESLRPEIRLIAEGHVHLSQRMDASEARTAHQIASLDSARDSARGQTREIAQADRRTKHESPQAQPGGSRSHGRDQLTG